MADADGFNSQFILAHREPIISPAWSPDGTRIAYVSFEQGRSIVFIHNLVDGTRRVLADYDGINSAPAWSPDGKRLALALSKDGVSQIYMIDADGSGVARLTYSNAIDTEPSFSPDGQVHPVHLGPRRQPADLPYEPVGQQHRAHDLRGQLQRHAALQSGRQILRLSSSAARDATAWR